MVVGLAVFFGLALGCRLLYNQTEDRLLQQRTSEAAAAIQLSLDQVRAPLDAAAKLAEATNGDPTAFQRILEPFVGADKTFTSAILYRIGTTTPVAEVGIPTSLPIEGQNGASAMLDSAATEPFVVVDLLAGEKRRLGYAVADAATAPQYVAYGERTLSADPNVRGRTDAPFAQLDYAIYLGREPATDHLLGASVRDLPIGGRTADQVVAFGNTDLLLVMTPIGHLSGALFANLWWIVAVGGVLLAVAFATLTRRLLERRDTAMDLAADNERLYDEQRHIAETLQLSLLPQHLVAPDGVVVAARYWPAGSANLIGGDFYDLFAVDDDRWGVAIGDVCGKGIEAAALTGLARHTLRAAARNSTSPTEVLQAVHRALCDHTPATFCTAGFAFITPGNGASTGAGISYRIALALGGHPQPLLRHRDGRVEAVGTLGMLLGMLEPTLSTTVLDLAPGDTLVFYTDGLTDAPAEQAVSVEELATLLELEGDQPIEQLADAIRALKRGRRPQGSGDDTALLILRLEGPSLVTDRPIFANEPATSGGLR
jgi:serine phosphatase RsbU (regulator of sigma subunit)